MTKQFRSLQPNSEWDLQALILSKGEDDNELHIFDGCERELLALCFKVNTASAVGSKRSTMTLPDGDVIELLNEEGLEDEIERLASSGNHTYEQLKNMTEEHRGKYRLRLSFLGLVQAMKAAKRKRVGAERDLLIRMQSL